MYFVKTPPLVKKFFSSLVWDIPTQGKEIFLTFDDGPHAIATPFVLQQLQQFNARATFFCIGKNVQQQTELYKTILAQGHAVGNHTQNHVNGFKTSTKNYIEEVKQAAAHINSNLFRPPYGKITPFQSSLIKKMGYEIIMWDVLSGDFDVKLSPQQCAEYVVLNAKSGSIIVFHDSQKALSRLQVALPATLEHFSKLGFVFKAL